MVRKRIPHLAAIVAIASLFVPQTTHAAPLQTGPWRAWLDSPGGELPFEVELSRNGDTWQAVIFNGEKKVAILKMINKKRTPSLIGLILLLPCRSAVIMGS